MQTHDLPRTLQMAACTGCRACADVCPAVKASGDGKLSAPYRMQGLHHILGARFGGLLARLLRVKTMDAEALDHFADTVYRCSLCGNCQEACPVGIGLKDLWLALRRDLVVAGHYPNKINMIRDNVLESRNVFAEDNDERADWTEDLDDEPEDKLVRERAEVVFFTGCTAAYFPVAQKIPLALAELLQAAEVDFTLLGHEEWCCGFPMLGAGLVDLLPEFVEHNLEMVKAKGAREVIFSCPSCYAMWLEHYPYRDAGIEIFHATQYLDRLVTAQRLPLKELRKRVTYHDPCDLGRTAREFDAPRRILAAIPGLEFVELPRNRENCSCCGGGGNLEMVDAQLSTGIAKAKVEEALSVGAEAIVTSCQQCVRTMLTYAKRNKAPLDVMDITQLLRRALDD